MALTARTITVQLKANRPPVPGEYWAWQANKLTVDITLPDGETFDGADSLYCELHSVEFPTDDPPLANVIITSPTGDNAVFEFTGAQMNQTLTAKEGVFWLVIFSNTDDEAPEVIWGSKLKLKAHHASLTTPAPPEPTLALTQTSGDARYRRLSVDIAQSSITGLVTALTLLAPLASPAFTGAPTAPTAANGTNTTQIATCAFVLANASARGTWGSITGTLAAQTDLGTALSGKAPLESPSFTYGISVSDGISTDDLTATGLVNTGSLQVNGNIVFAAGSNFAFGTTTERGSMRSALGLGALATLGMADITTVGTLVAGAVPTSLLTGTITNAQLAGSIAASKLVGTDITTVGTLVAGAVPTSLLTGTITNAQLAGSIAASKLVGTDIATVGTLVAGAVPTTLLTGTITNAQLAGSIDLTAKVTGNLPVTNGGTGRATGTTAYGLLAAGTTATGAQQTLPAGATTEILVGGGASALPVWTSASGSGAPVRAVSPTITGTLSAAAIISTQTNLLTTPTDGVFINNSSAATVGQQQYSPALALGGAGWATSGSSSMAVKFREYVVPVQGSSAPSGLFTWDSSVGGGGATTQMTLSTAGALVVTTSVSAALYYGAGGTGGLIRMDGNTSARGLGIGSLNQIAWQSGAYAGGTVNGDLMLQRKAAANLRQGDADAAAPVAQTSSVQSVVAGTTNTAGADRTYSGSQGTGTGVGGAHIFQVAPAGSTGSAQNALVEAVRITGAGVMAASLGQVVGATSLTSSSLLEVVSTTKGFLPPKHTTTQRDAVASPVAGLMVYNTTTNKLNFYNGSAWEAVTSA